MHDWLQDRSEGRDTDSRSDKDGVLGTEDLGRRSTEGTVNVDLKKIWRSMVLLERAFL